ncbi:tripartite motif-containing protein 3 isoform X2 [Anabrus simplex]|uniref:tripartite motif-containing protein 3 isoform X2 n=1 Tax=Anabrus simplex TaxID=316456 RepID=UPI0035A276DB
MDSSLGASRRRQLEIRRGSLPVTPTDFQPPTPTKKEVSFQRMLSSSTEHVIVDVQRNGHKNKLLRVNTVSSYDLKERHKFSKTPPLSPTAMKSASGIQDLLQCPVCGDRLNDPKMMPCQHTFCASCLQDRLVTSKGRLVLRCPTCQLELQMNSAEDISALPSNLYIDSLLKLVGQPDGPSDEKARCVRCQTVCDKINNCQHCRQIFCEVCWSSHMAELKTQLGSLKEELRSAMGKLQHRTEDYKDRCEKLPEQIDEAVELRIQEIKQVQNNLLNEANELLKKGILSSEELMNRLKATEENVVNGGGFDDLTDNSQKVAQFLKMHRATTELLVEVSHWGEARPVFDSEALRLDIQDETDDAEEPEEGEADVERQVFELQRATPDNLSLYYRSRSFVPRLHIGRSALQRPGGVGVAPWAGGELLYVAGTDNHQVLVFERARGKLLRRLTAPELLCPQGIAFSEAKKEVYVTDKWNHCIHVFDESDAYLRSFGRKGAGEGQFRSPEGIATVTEDDGEDLLYVCDTGNDRLQVVRASDGAMVGQLGLVEREVHGVLRLVTEFNQPTGVAVSTQHDRLVVADFGNKRIKVYSLKGEKLHEFGSLGGSRGQFRSPECIALDPSGFILVGDSGNARVQIFRPNGNLVRTFGGRGTGPGKFAWVSGIHVTAEYEVIVTDFKNHCMQVF